MKKSIVLLISCVAFAASLTGQTAEKALPDFTAIKAGGIFNVYLVQSDHNSVVIEGDSSLVKQVSAEVENGTLTISFQGKFKWKGKEDKIPKITVQVKSLEKITAHGTADIISKNQLIADKLLIESGGSGTVKVDVKTNEIKAIVHGAGDVKLTGTTALLDAEISGAGDLKAFGLETDKAVVRVSGAGDARVNAKNSIDAKVSGVGDITYKGDPGDKQITTSGMGSVLSADRPEVKTTAPPVPPGAPTPPAEPQPGLPPVPPAPPSSPETPSAPDENKPTKIRVGSREITISHNGDSEHEKNCRKGCRLCRPDGIEMAHHALKDKKRKSRGKTTEVHWAGVEFGVNGYLDKNYDFGMPAGYNFLELDYGKSFFVNLNIMEQKLPLFSKYVHAVTGLGFEFNNYRFENNITLVPDIKPVAAVGDTIAFRKNKLAAAYITAPLLIEFNTRKKERKSFHFAFGMVLGYRIGTHTKQVYDIGNTPFKPKVRDDYNLNPFRYSATVRTGYSVFNVFASYSLAGLFKANGGPELHPFTVGVTLVGF